MKKVLAILLALAMILSFAACGEKKEEPKKDEPAKVWPDGIDQVTVLIPQPVGAMVDQSTRIMIDYLNEKYPNTKFVPENDDSASGNKQGIQLAQAPGDGTVIMAHGAGAIINYYSGVWEYNLADTSKFISVCGNVGQLQPSGGVFLTQVGNPNFQDLLGFVQYVKDNPGKVTVAYGQGTPHEIRFKLITNYYGISDLINWQPGSTKEVETWILGGNVDAGILTETTACNDIRGGKVMGFLDSLTSRNYTDDLKDVLDNVPIVTDYVKDQKEADGLVCAWPMTVYAPASMSEEMAKQINEAFCGIADSPDYMARIKQLGSSNTYQIFSYDEINRLTQVADQQIKDVFESFKK